MLRTVIIGAGEWGKVVLDILQDSPDVKVAGFLDDNKDVNSTQIAGIPVLGDFKIGNILTTAEENNMLR